MLSPLDHALLTAIREMSAVEFENLLWQLEGLAGNRDQAESLRARARELQEYVRAVPVPDQP